MAVTTATKTRKNAKRPTLAELKKVHVSTLRNRVAQSDTVPDNKKVNLIRMTKDELLLLLTGDPLLKKQVTVARRNATRAANQAARA